MSMENCPPIVGGLCYIQWGDRRLECSGSVKVRPGKVKREAKATGSGRMVLTEEARLQEAEMDLWDLSDSNPMWIFEEGCQVNVTVVCKSTRRRYQFTKCSVVGDPEVDLTVGTVSGIVFATDAFSQS